MVLCSKSPTQRPIHKHQPQALHHQVRQNTGDASLNSWCIVEVCVHCIHLNLDLHSRQLIISGVTIELINTQEELSYTLI